MYIVHYTIYVHRVLGWSIVCGCKLDGHIYIYCTYTYIYTYITYLRTYIAYRPTILYIGHSVLGAQQMNLLDLNAQFIIFQLLWLCIVTILLYVHVGRYTQYIALDNYCSFHTHHAPGHTCLMSLSLCQCHMSLWRNSNDCVVLHGTTCPCVLGIYTCLNGYWIWIHFIFCQGWHTRGCEFV